MRTTGGGITIAHVGYSGTDDDRDRRLAVDVWIRRNDTDMLRRLQATAGERPKEDLIDLNCSPSRDFLAENQRYDIVVIHNLWGFPGASSLNDSGATACSPLHNASAWRNRLNDAAACYIFMFGRHFTPACLETLPVDYECFRVPALAVLSILAKTGRNLDRATATQPITLHDMSSARLRSLPALSANEILDLSFTNLRSKDIARLTTMPRLTNLSLAQTNVADRDLARIVQSKGIRTLNLDDTSVSDEGIEHVSTLRHLQCLSLNNTRVGDCALAHLRSSQTLEWLSLVGTDVGDAGLELLTKIQSLRYLSLVNTRVTPSKVAALRNALPECWTDPCCE
jgi:hypothetical protein